jgi:hypothetical protein
LQTNVSENHLEKAFSFSNKKIVETFEKDKLLGIFLGFNAVSEVLKFSHAKFTCFFHCHGCGQDVSSTGSAVVPKAAYPNEQIRLKVEYFSPTVPLFSLQAWTPPLVKGELLHAFNYFHSDLTASGAKIRRAVEQFCAELGFNEGNLHKRLQLMAVAHPMEAEWLQNVKWLGNEATHSNNIDEDDLLHSFEIMEEALELFRRKSKFSSVQNASRRLEEKFKKP